MGPQQEELTSEQAQSTHNTERPRLSPAGLRIQGSQLKSGGEKEAPPSGGWGGACAGWTRPPASCLGAKWVAAGARRPVFLPGFRMSQGPELGLSTEIIWRARGPSIIAAPGKGSGPGDGHPRVSLAHSALRAAIDLV
jgi:hypothetical protein